MKTMDGTELKQMYDVDQFMHKAGEYATATATDVVLGQSVTFRTDPEQGIVMGFGDQEAPLSVHGIKDVIAAIDMKPDYFKHTPAELLMPHFNYYYQNYMQGKEIRLLQNEGKVVGVQRNPTDKFIKLPIMMDVIQDSIGAENILGYHKPVFNWSGIVINVILKETFQVVLKDPLYLGIRFIHSLTDIKAGQAMAYTFRQWCSNGAISMDKLASWDRKQGGERLLRRWVPSVVSEARKALELEKGRLADLVTKPAPEEVSELLDNLLQGQHVAKEVREDIRSIAIDNPINNMYDVWNVLTNATTHSSAVAEHPRSLPTLENVAKDLAGGKYCLCPTCHRKMQNK
jgi:hypothetical protein